MGLNKGLYRAHASGSKANLELSRARKSRDPLQWIIETDTENEARRTVSGCSEP